MSVIYDIAGTTSDSFSMNGKVTLLQGDADPQAYQGVMGDFYFQSTGHMWAKILDEQTQEVYWLRLDAAALPDPSTGPYQLLYSNGTNYALADIHVTPDGKLITEDPILIDPVLQKQDSTVNGGHLYFERADNDPTKSASSDVEPYIEFYNGGFRFVGKNSSGTVITPLSISIQNNKATTVKPSASNSISDETIPTIGWVNDPATATNVVHRSGDETINGTKTFTSDIMGNAYAAYWGDLAEYYDADNEYPVGTLMTFGGNKEVTIATEDCNAVISSKPGVILNSGENFEHPCKLALVGRVPVRVIGTCKKFDYLQLSEIPGVARALPNLDDFKFNNIIARALENKDSEEEGLVLCVVKFEL